MGSRLYESRDSNRRRDWFEGTTWFDPNVDPVTGKRRSGLDRAQKRLSDGLNGLSGRRNRHYGDMTPEEPDTVHLVHYSGDDYDRTPYTPTPMKTLPYTPTPMKTLNFTPSTKARDDYNDRADRSDPISSSGGVKSSPSLAITRKILGLHPTAPVVDEHNEAEHSELLWPRIRLALREPFAEFWGTFTLVLFGDGAIAQTLLSTNQANAPGGDGFGNYLSISWGFGLGLMLGIYVAGDSGAFLNPAATFTNCMLRKLPWRRFPMYFLAQLAGAFCAAGVIYANYICAIDNYEGVGIRTAAPSATATAGIFATYPQPFTTKVQQFFQEFLGSAILMFVIFALQDTSNKGAAVGGGNWFPLALFFLMFGISTCFGWQTGFAINPARDLGPRLMTAAAGYKGVWSAGDYYFWIPIVAPFCGCAAGGILYDLFIFTGPSPINSPWMGLNKLFRPDKAVKQRIAHHKHEGAV